MLHVCLAGVYKAEGGLLSSLASQSLGDVVLANPDDFLTAQSGDKHEDGCNDSACLQSHFQIHATAIKILTAFLIMQQLAPPPRCIDPRYQLMVAA